MFNRRGLVAVLALSGILAISGIAVAKGPHKHQNGKNALGEKLKKNGKHEVGKAGKHSVIAEVNNGKIVNMTAGTLPVKRVKTKKKMVGLESGKIKFAANGDIQLAQSSFDVWYYGYGFDTGEEEYYYWYTADEVIVTETWIEYTTI